MQIFNSILIQTRLIIVAILFFNNTYICYASTNHKELYNKGMSLIAENKNQQALEIFNQAINVKADFAALWK